MNRSSTANLTGRVRHSSGLRRSRELTETLRRLAPLLTGNRTGGVSAGFNLARLGQAQAAFAGLDKALDKLIPRLNGFGTLLRRVIADAVKLGTRSLLGNVSGNSRSFGGVGSSGGRSLPGLGALLTNPWTAVIGGGLTAGLLIWNHFRHGTEKQLRTAIQNTYGVNVREMQVLTQIKTIGEQAFGRGQVSRHLLETIGLDPAKEMIQSYADSTGQRANNLITAAQLGDQGWAGNRFIRSTGGASVTTGASIGGPSNSVSVGQSGRRSPDSAPQIMLSAMMGAVERLSAQVEKFTAIPAGHVLALGAAENPGAVGAAILTVANDDYGFTDRLLTKTGQR
jgi:hypothetical protein